MIGSSSDFARRLRAWYLRHRRDLPWRLPKNKTRSGRLNPYHVLVSEAMLQQTQVVTVIPYFHRFLQQFPTIEALADADPQQVLRAWQGLGYYSRARNLQSAAMVICSQLKGKIPATVDELLKLPGIGRYTAGAVASIAFEKRAPILDGNVARVLCRIDAVRSDPRDPKTRADLWKRAEEILPGKKVGDFNSALMELGALVCTPRAPQCLICPVRSNCEAATLGLQDQIPPPRRSKKAPLFQRWTFCIRCDDRYLVEQRPARGRWAGMWQFATIEPAEVPPSSRLIKRQFSLDCTDPIEIGMVEHALTHRRYRFTVFTCDCTAEPTGTFATLAELNARPIPRPHLKIREMLLARI